MCPYCSRFHSDPNYRCPWRCERCNGRLVPGPGSADPCICLDRIERALAQIEKEIAPAYTGQRH